MSKCDFVYSLQTSLLLLNCPDSCRPHVLKSQLYNLWPMKKLTTEHSSQSIMEALSVQTASGSNRHLKT